MKLSAAARLVAILVCVLGAAWTCRKLSGHRIANYTFVTLPQLISVTPSPIPSVPCWVQVCYDFDSTAATSPVVIEISFPGTGFSYPTEVSKEEPCVPVYVPAGANRVAVVDTTKQSQDGGALVEPD